MKISETIEKKIIYLYCTTQKSSYTILHEVAPNGEITYDELYSFLQDYISRNPDNAKRCQGEAFKNRILELLESGLTKEEISEELCVQPYIISKRINEMKKQGVKIPKIKKLPKKDNDENDTVILELLKNGMNQKAIANTLGVSTYNISNRIKKMKNMGKTIPVPKRKKTKNDEKDNKILELLSNGLAKKEIAKLLGVTPETISNRINGMKKRGIHIPEGILDKTDKKILELLNQNYKQSEIAKKLNISRTKVIFRIQRMKKRGVTITKKNDKTDNKILELLSQDFCIYEIAESLGISSKVISRRLTNMEKRGVKIPEIKDRREKNNEKKDSEILKLLSQNVSHKKIAEKLGVTQVTISRRIKAMKERGIEIPQKSSKKSDSTKKTNSKPEEIKSKRTIALKIISLMDTKNASEEEVIIMAKLYDVDDQVTELLKSSTRFDVNEEPDIYEIR